VRLPTCRLTPRWPVSRHAASTTAWSPRCVCPSWPRCSTSLCRPTGKTSRAEICFKRALEIARRQHAKSWELRAATSLACLWQSQGKRQQAYDLLAPVYHWFTEGFDTADLRQAKTLLERLVASE
jgi:hypothetical protein